MSYFWGFIQNKNFPMASMLQLIKDYPTHLADSLAKVHLLNWQAGTTDIHHVVITGLGGSGIGGSVAAEVCAASATVPIVVNKGYALPAWVNANTHVIACSYSGNTEETLSALEDATKAGCMVSAITSGGQLLAKAEAAGWNLSVLPAGNPPRSMFGLAIVQLMAHLEAMDIGVDARWQAQVSEASEGLIQRRDAQMAEAKDLAMQMQGRTYAIYAASGVAGVATRWRQQLNENSKMPGWDSEVPEMNHNEMVGWAGGNDSHIAIFLHSNNDHPSNTLRMNLNAAAIEAYGVPVLHVHAYGEGHLAQCLDLVAMGDWVSQILSEVNQVDIMDIVVIEKLKAALAEAAKS